MKFVRQGGRCPATDFLANECEQGYAKKFRGEFHAIVNDKGAKYENHQRFKALQGRGKPLWEFKHKDHRLYCLRIPNKDAVEIVLFNGWIKDKAGKAREEDNRITTAQGLLGEYQLETEAR